MDAVWTQNVCWQCARVKRELIYCQLRRLGRWEQNDLTAIVARDSKFQHGLPRLLTDLIRRDSKCHPLTPLPDGSCVDEICQATPLPMSQRIARIHSCSAGGKILRATKMPIIGTCGNRALRTFFTALKCEPAVSTSSTTPMTLGSGFVFVSSIS